MKVGDEHEVDGVEKKMHFEATVYLERGDREILLADLAAVEALLLERKTARVIRRAETILSEAA